MRVARVATSAVLLALGLLLAYRFCMPRRAARTSLDMAAAVEAFNWTVAALRQRRWQANQSPTSPCWRHVLASVATSQLALVLTWSRGSRGAAEKSKRYEALGKVTDAFLRWEMVRLVVDAKGSRCAELPKVLGRWSSTGRLHCMQGPNMGAREAHTILRFVLEFYDHLPAATIFMQDDPIVNALLHIGRSARNVGRWVRALEASYEARALAGLNSTVGVEWAPSPCACSKEQGPATKAHNAYYRSMSWWLDAFIAGPAAELLLKDRLRWPRAAQFAVTREAVRRRSRAFYARNAALASLSAPLKSTQVLGGGDLADDERRCVAKERGHEHEEGHCSMTLGERKAKRRNFGPWVADLGVVRRGESMLDSPDAIHGNELGLLLERLWFVIFDAAHPEAVPPYPECFTIRALAASPVRCGARGCPEAAGRPRDAGCALTDALGQTAAPRSWRFAPGQRRCLEPGCWATGPRAAEAADSSALAASQLADAVVLPGGAQASFEADEGGHRGTVRCLPADLAVSLKARVDDGWVSPECIAIGAHPAEASQGPPTAGGTHVGAAP